MTPEKFWFGWMRITMLTVVIVGAIIALVTPFVTPEFLDQKINNAFFPGEIPRPSSDLMKKWLLGVSGAVMLGWGCTMWYIVNKPFRRREKWAWRSVFYPIIIWYLIDSSVSAYFGANFNVVINSILFLQIMAPLLSLRNQFFPAIKTVS